LANQLLLSIALILMKLVVQGIGSRDIEDIEKCTC